MFQTQLSMRVPKHTVGPDGGSAHHQHEPPRKSMFHPSPNNPQRKRSDANVPISPLKRLNNKLMHTQTLREENKDSEQQMSQGAPKIAQMIPRIETDYKSTQNWFELRVTGKNTERRGYHSTFVHQRK